MNKITMRLNADGKIVGIFQKGKNHKEELSENETLRLINRISKRDCDIRFRKTPRTKKAELRILGDGLNYNIEMINYVDVLKRAKDVNKAHRERVKAIKTGAAVTVAVAFIGIGAAALIHKTSNKQYDPEIDSQLTESNIEEYTSTLPVITEEMIDNYGTVNFEDGTTVEIDNPSALRVELDNNSLYDPGIEKRNQPYVDMIEQRANRWGVSYDLLYDVVSQEYGGPTDKTNICHVVFDSWEDQIISAFNNETKQTEYIVLTNNPENYEKITADRSNAGKPNAVDQTISQEELRNPETSLSICCIILKYCNEHFKGNVPLAIQAYNNGVGAVDQIVVKTADATGNTPDAIIDDKDGVYWLKWRNVGQKGDPNYFYNVAKHMSDENENENTYWIQIEKDGNILDSVYKVVNAGLLQEQDTSEQAPIEEIEQAKGR